MPHQDRPWPRPAGPHGSVADRRDRRSCPAARHVRPQSGQPPPALGRAHGGLDGGAPGRALGRTSAVRRGGRRNHSHRMGDEPRRESCRADRPAARDVRYRGDDRLVHRSPGTRRAGGADPAPRTRRVSVRLSCPCGEPGDGQRVRSSGRPDRADPRIPPLRRIPGRGGAACSPTKWDTSFVATRPRR